MKNISNIGNTPMIKIVYKYKGNIKYVYAKLEWYNLTGSIKDRVALYILEQAKKRNELQANQEIVEATSGNTGISLAAIGQQLGHEVHIYMPDFVSIERVKLMEGFGAHVTLISKQAGGFKKCLEEAKNYALTHNAFLANQFANHDNLLAHYNTTGKEIIAQIPECIGGFVSGVGTGGTLMGCSKIIKERLPKAISCAVEPESMPLMTSGEIIAQHKIEGIGDDFIPKLVDISKIDRIFLINDIDAIVMAQKFSHELGLGIGISSGANFLGSVLLAEHTQEAIVTVFADDNKKYLSTELFKEQATNVKHISNDIELLYYEVC